MTLHTWHTLTGLFLLIFFSGKVYLHALLDYRQQRSMGFLYSLLYPVPYFKSYSAPVRPEVRILKKVCNLLLALSITALLANFAVGMAIYISEFH